MRIEVMVSAKPLCPGPNPGGASSGLAVYGKPATIFAIRQVIALRSDSAFGE
jgi:hypothetical protein